jgi:hypothetical protein
MAWGKDGRAGLGGVGRVVWWDGCGDGEVVVIYSDFKGGWWRHATVHTVKFVGEEPIAGGGGGGDEFFRVGR